MKSLVSWKEITTGCSTIADQICKNNIYINSIVGLSRGGLVPATILAHMLNIREVMVHGYHSYDEEAKCRDPKNSHGVMYQDVMYDLMKGLPGRDILIVDDLCDEGVTMKGLVKRMYKKFHKGVVNISTAALFCKERSIFTPDYIGSRCDNRWLVFPWEVSK